MAKETSKTLKADEDLMNSLHQMVALDLIKRLSTGEATVQELSAAIKYLKDNNITADIEFNRPLQQLTNEVTPTPELPFIDEDEDESIG